METVTLTRAQRRALTILAQDDAEAVVTSDDFYYHQRGGVGYASIRRRYQGGPRTWEHGWSISTTTQTLGALAERGLVEVVERTNGLPYRWTITAEGRAAVEAA